MMEADTRIFESPGRVWETNPSPEGTANEIFQWGNLYSVATANRLRFEVMGPLITVCDRQTPLPILEPIRHRADIWIGPLDGSH